MKDIDIIEHFDIHLHGMNDVQLTPSLLKVAALVRNRALSGKNLGHVVVLHIAQSLFRVF